MPLDFKASILEVLAAMNPAQRVIEKCGGVARVAALTNRTTSWVYKWTYPKEKNGRGGYVPHEDAEALLAAAKRGEVDLDPADFFDIPQSPDNLQPRT